MPKIFLSYRREDSEDVTGRIYDQLERTFGKENVFRDVDDIPAGVDFKQHLREAARECRVVLAVIGKRWLEASDRYGRRLDNPHDVVRIEIEFALQENMAVIPLLVGGAAPPDAEDLPASLKPLADRNGIKVRSDADFRRDMERVVKAVEGYLAPPSPPKTAAAPAAPDAAAVAGELPGTTGHDTGGLVEMRSAQNCYVMCVDMARFSHIFRSMALQLRDEELASLKLQDQIREILIRSFERTGRTSFDEALLKFMGDGGLFVFGDPAEAHQVAEHILREAEFHNAKAREHQVEHAMRCFRIGIAYGPLGRDVDGRIAGLVIAEAVRLEGGGPSGEIRVSAEFYRRLPVELRQRYGGREPIPTGDEGFDIPGHRCAVTGRALWPETARGTDRPYAPPVPNKEFAEPSQPRPRERCFVVSPIGNQDRRNDDVLDLLIVPACRLAGFDARRADQIAGGNRKHVITDELTHAPLVICYLGRPTPHWNADVMLEVGYRVATGLPLVILSEEPHSSAGGPALHLMDLLPFNLKHHTVVALPPEPDRVVERVVQEIHAAVTPARSAYRTPHAVMEVRVGNPQTVFTAVSPEARRVFANSAVPNGNLVEWVKWLEDQMPAAQYQAFLEEQDHLLRAVLAPEPLFRPRGSAAATSPTIPAARVPIVLAGVAPDGVDLRGYLPVLVSYRFDDRDSVWMRVLYLDVTRCMTRDPTGIYVV